MIKAFGKDDIAMMVTLFLFTAYAACQLGGVAHGTGKHRDLLTDANAQIALRYWFFCELFYTLSTSALKIAIGYFLLRIAVKPLHVWTIRLIMICSATFGSAYFLIVLFQCKPISYWWDLDPNHNGKCLSPSLMTDTTYVISALNSVADWVFGLLPVFIIKDLQMKRSIKIIVTTILGFAAVYVFAATCPLNPCANEIDRGSAATIIRMPYLWTAKQYKGDFLWRTADIAIWTTVEVGIGITAGCVATLKPLMKSFLSFVGYQSTTTRDSGMPWSTKRKTPSKQGFSIHDQPLDNLRPANDKSMTTTTVTGRGFPNTTKGLGLSSWADRTRRESEEDFFSTAHPPGVGFLDMKGWKGGISKSVEVSTTEERKGSHGSSSISADTDEDKPYPILPAVAFERL